VKINSVKKILSLYFNRHIYMLMNSLICLQLGIIFVEPPFVRENKVNFSIKSFLAELSKYFVWRHSFWIWCHLHESLVSLKHVDIQRCRICLQNKKFPQAGEKFPPVIVWKIPGKIKNSPKRPLAHAGRFCSSVDITCSLSSELILCVFEYLSSTDRYKSFLDYDIRLTREHTQVCPGDFNGNHVDVLISVYLSYVWNN